MPEATNLPSFRLDGLVAMVTGSGTGIGAGIASGFAEAGADLVLVGRTVGPLEATARRVESFGRKAAIIVCDLTDRAELRRRVASLPSLDILVNNAGTSIPEAILEVTDTNLDAMVNLNVTALFVASQAATRKMLDAPDRTQRGGAIVNISSQMGHVGAVNRTVYCMTKHAVEGLTKAMAIELAPHRIRVNSVGPTLVDTPLARRVVDTPEKRAYFESRIPLGSWAKVEDIVAAALYLASPAAAMVTGAHLLVDGGWTAQ
jgi:NAD(P)-dependent dehydrogenase (short-subunit alcohol dehydrogenase family)